MPPGTGRLWVYDDGMIAPCERCIRSLQEEALHHMRRRGVRSLDEVIHQSLVHDHLERNHQGREAA